MNGKNSCNITDDPVIDKYIQDDVKYTGKTYKKYKKMERKKKVMANRTSFVRDKARQCHYRSRHFKWAQVGAWLVILLLMLCALAPFVK